MRSARRSIASTGSRRHCWQSAALSTKSSGASKPPTARSACASTDHRPRLVGRARFRHHQYQFCARSAWSRAISALPVPVPRPTRVCGRVARVMVVVATTPDELLAVRARLAQLGAPTADVVAVSEVRTLVLAPVEDESEAERLVATLRAEGWLVVARPEDGVRLEAWLQHTRPLVFADRISVCFAWSEHDRGNLPAVIELGAGGFGNGEHPATR